MSDKIKFERRLARDVADSIVQVLTPGCERIEVAGSLRRRQKLVGDIEILYIPKRGLGTPAGSLFEEEMDLATEKIDHMEAARVLQRRQNINGAETYGAKNKLMRHCASGIPVDLFVTDQQSWFNYLVCRTGPAAFNIRVASRARELGWKWNPYNSGFSRTRTGSCVWEWRVIGSEEALFEFLGWEYLHPWERKAEETK